MHLDEAILLAVFLCYSVYILSIFIVFEGRFVLWHYSQWDKCQ